MLVLVLVAPRGADNDEAVCKVPLLDRKLVRRLSSFKVLVGIINAERHISCESQIMSVAQPETDEVVWCERADSRRSERTQADGVIGRVAEDPGAKGAKGEGKSCLSEDLRRADMRVEGTASSTPANDVDAMRTIALLAAFAGVAAAASSSSHPQIFIHAPSAPARQHPGAISVTGAQAGAILASHLGATQNEQLPLDNTGSREWQSALARQSWSAPAGGAGRTVVVLECPKHGCAGLVPDTFADSTTLDVPNLPVNSWTSLLTTQIHRLAESLGIDAATSPAIAGLDQLIESFTGVSSWFTWVSDELRQAVKSFQKAAKDKAGDVWIAVHDEPEANAGLLTALDFLDESAKKLVGELTSMVAFTDSVVSSRSGGDAADDSPQSQCPGSRVLALHLQGMKVSTAYAAQDSVLTGTDLAERR